MTQRLSLSAAKVSPKAAAAMASFHAPLLELVQATVAREPVVVLGMAQNPFVKRARRALTAAGIDFKYLEYGSYLSQWQPRLALKLWSGWPTFPQIFVRGTLIGGCTDVEAAIKDGSLVAMLKG